MNAYMKLLKSDGSGSFVYVQLEAETEESLNLKRDMYLADGYGDSTKEEYDADVAASLASSDMVGPGTDAAPEPASASDASVEVASEVQPEAPQA